MKITLSGAWGLIGKSQNVHVFDDKVTLLKIVLRGNRMLIFDVIMFHQKIIEIVDFS